MSEWISVNDGLPTKVGQDCWVWGKGLPRPETDKWVGNRGEKATILILGTSRIFTKSGWYFNEAYNITHWMPIELPELPK